MHSAIMPMQPVFFQLQAKVAVLGAAGGIGQPLSLLLKSNPHIDELSLFDVANTAGVAADLSHISTAARVKAYTGQEQLPDALKGCHLVIIPAGTTVKSHIICPHLHGTWHQQPCSHAAAYVQAHPPCGLFKYCR